MTKVITISREFGSGGRTIGKRVAEELGIKCYDRTIIAEVAKASGFTEDYVRSMSEDVASSSILGWLSGGAFGNTNHHQIWAAQYNLIHDIAEKGPCVIVGRCGDYILQDYDNLLKVFIHADKEKRIERVVNEYKEFDAEGLDPLSRINIRDKKRKQYYELATGNEWGLADNYDIALNSGTLGIEECVRIIVDIAKK
ncbi:MAG: cytidylate kinase-like family protein [Solobacterium sp.]|nr:cytidylate kinase-like family protein [Solobacterium sp.]